MNTPIKPSTDKVPQRYYPLSLKPSNDEEFPLAYVDDLWDVVQEGSSLAELTEAIGQFDQHTINELFSYLIILRAKVVANPEGEATETINKIGINGTNYLIPQTDTSNLATKKEVQQGLAKKQNVIQNLLEIISGANAGATAIQGIKKGTNFLPPDADKVVTIPSDIESASAQSVPSDQNASANIVNHELQLEIPRGADAVNPFKGMFITLSDTNIPSIGQAGDYIFIADDNPATTIDLYFWNTAKTPSAGWDDTGYDIAPGSLAEFAGGTAVSMVYIINNFTTGGSTNVASAETVKVLNQRFVSEEAIDIANIERDKLHITFNSSNQYYLQWSGGYPANTHIAIPVTAGDKITITANPSYKSYYAFLRSHDVVATQEADFVIGKREVYEIAADTTEIITIPDGCNYFYVDFSGTASWTYVPSAIRKSMTVDIKALKGIVYGIETKMGNAIKTHSLITKARESYMSVEYDNNDYSYTRCAEWRAHSGDEDNYVEVPTPIDPNASTRTLEYVNNYIWTPRANYEVPDQFESAVSIQLDQSETSHAIRNLLPNRIYLWRVKTNTGKILSSGTFRTIGEPRIVQIESVDASDVANNGYVRNTRDIGGWKTDSGKKIRHGVIYRGYAFNYYDSDNDTWVSRLNSVGINTAKNILGINAELDLRESDNNPGYSALGSGVAFADFPIDLMFFRLNIYWNPTPPPHSVTHEKRGLNLFVDCLRQVIQWLKEGRSIYAHCTGGCDRTGFLMAAIEGIVGVSENDINKDYEFSERFRNRELYLVGKKETINGNIVTYGYDGDFVFAIDFIKNLVEINGNYYTKALGYNDTYIIVNSTRYNRGSIVYGGDNDMDIEYYGWISSVDESVIYTVERYPDSSSEVYVYSNDDYEVDSTKSISAITKRFWYNAINETAIGSAVTPTPISDQELISTLEEANIGSFKERWHRLMKMGGMAEREMQELENLICC